MRLHVFAAAMLLSSCLTSKAVTLQYSAALEQGGSLSGTVQYNPDITLFSSPSLTINLGGATYLFNVPTNQVAHSDNINSQVYLDGAGDALFLHEYQGYPTPPYPLPNPLCTENYYCANLEAGHVISELDLASGKTYNLISGTTTLANTTTVTPEPSSIALLGTGVFAIAGLLRRRFA